MEKAMQKCVFKIGRKDMEDKKTRDRNYVKKKKKVGQNLNCYKGKMKDKTTTAIIDKL